jgi:2-polyprenyl-3-methyl-5-hydroxy-6-metoxy-1,4-benzoquinol methylase
LHPPIVRCRKCGLVYANPRINTQLIEENYAAVDDPVYVEERDGRVITFRKNFLPLEALVATKMPGKLLDVGCHIGVMLEIAKERGWQAVGIEPSKWAAERARERGLEVINSGIASAPLEPNSFDAISMWDVIEHLTDPATDLAHLHRCLKPGGVIGIHTIDVESHFARLMGSRWPWLMEMHLYYFSPRTLGKMLEQIGFKVEKTMYQGRYLRLGYFVSRLEAYSPALSRGLGWMVNRLGLASTAIPVNFRDLFTIFARKI